MNLRLLSLPLLFLILVCQSCENKPEKKVSAEKTDPQNSTIKTTYTDGTTKAEIPYKSGKKHGLAKEYYQSGKVFQAIDYANGIKHGFARRYYENGNLYQETPYDSGKIHGVQKKYKQNGKLTSEMPYNYGEPCTGLKEYKLDGSLKKNYPTIVVKTVDEILKEHRYSVILSMSDKVKSVEYFDGSLDGKCLGSSAQPICCADRFGVAEIHYNVYPGQFIMKQLNIIAKVKTTHDNYYFTYLKYNVAVENRY